MNVNKTNNVNFKGFAQVKNLTPMRAYVLLELMEQKNVFSHTLYDNLASEMSNPGKAFILTGKDHFEKFNAIHNSANCLAVTDSGFDKLVRQGIRKITGNKLPEIDAVELIRGLKNNTIDPKTFEKIG